jgi:hypothetical protein
MGEQLKVWTFLVHVVDEDYDWARKRLTDTLERASVNDYAVETWPGEI